MRSLLLKTSRGSWLNREKREDRREEREGRVDGRATKGNQEGKEGELRSGT